MIVPFDRFVTIRAKVNSYFLYITGVKYLIQNAIIFSRYHAKNTMLFYNLHYVTIFKMNEVENFNIFL